MSLFTHFLPLNMSVYFFAVPNVFFNQLVNPVVHKHSIWYLVFQNLHYMKLVSFPYSRIALASSLTGAKFEATSINLP